MRAKFGSIVVDGRGKLGGQFFSRSKQGNFLATNSYSKSPGTIVPSQTSVRPLNPRAITTSLSTRWRNLSDADREKWNAQAKIFETKNGFGDSVRLSGFQLFSKQNFWLFYDVGLITEVPVPMGGVPSVDVFQVTIIISPPLWNITIRNNGLPGFIVLHASAGVSPGMSPTSAKTKFIDLQPLQTGFNNLFFQQAYLDFFPTPPLNSKIAFKALFLSINYFPLYSLYTSVIYK